jgi:hypothetical protein
MYILPTLQWPELGYPSSDHDIKLKIKQDIDEKVGMKPNAPTAPPCSGYIQSNSLTQMKVRI